MLFSILKKHFLFHPYVIFWGLLIMFVSSLKRLYVQQMIPSTTFSMSAIQNVLWDFPNIDFKVLVFWNRFHHFIETLISFCRVEGNDDGVGRFTDTLGVGRFTDTLVLKHQTTRCQSHIIIILTLWSQSTCSVQKLLLRL